MSAMKLVLDAALTAGTIGVIIWLAMGMAAGTASPVGIMSIPVLVLYFMNR